MVTEKPSDPTDTRRERAHAGPELTAFASARRDRARVPLREPRRRSQPGAARRASDGAPRERILLRRVREARARGTVPG